MKSLMAAGFSGHVTKPIDIDHLIEVLAGLLGATATEAAESAQPMHAARPARADERAGCCPVFLIYRTPPRGRQRSIASTHAKRYLSCKHTPRYSAMARVTIRNLDDELLEQLKARARLHHRSLEGELRSILAEAAKVPEVVVAEADRIKADLQGRWRGDSTRLIREDRRR